MGVGCYLAVAMVDEHSRLARELQQLPSRGAAIVTGESPLHDIYLQTRHGSRVAVPIAEEQLRSLLADGVASSFGWREQTLSDPSVRDGLELDRTRVQPKGDEFAWALDELLETLPEAMGLDDELYLEFDKLVMYGPGQHFETHRDTERSDDMIGSFVLILPTEHRGGTLRITDSASGTVTCMEGHPTQLQWAAFYADCPHAVETVTDGHRIALLFHLRLRAPSRPKTQTPPAELLSALAERCISDPADDGHPNLTACTLDHAYTRANLDWKLLKGRDRHVVQYLLGATRALNLHMGLALIERHEVWQCEPRFEGRSRWSRYEELEALAETRSPPRGDRDLRLQYEVEGASKITYWHELGGIQDLEIAGYELLADELCQTTRFSDLDPDDSRYEGYMGNYGDTLERWYYRACVVLWPKRQDFSMLATMAPLVACRELLAQLRRGPKRKARAQARLEALAARWRDVRPQRPAASVSALATRLALRSRDPEVARAWLAPIAFNSTSPRSIERIARLMLRHGPDWSRALWSAWTGQGHGWHSNAFHRRARDLADALARSEDELAAELVDTLVHEAQRLLALAVDRHDARFKSRPPDAESVRALCRQLRHTWSMCQSPAHMQALDPQFRTIAASTRRHDPLLWSKTLRKMVEASDRRGRTQLVDALQPDLRVSARTLRRQLRKAERRPDDWRIQSKLACGCRDCGELQAFVRGPERSLTWPIGKARRAHIHQMIEAHGLPLSHETQRSGSPQKLVLRKQDTLFELEADQRASARREKNRTRRLLRNLGSNSNTRRDSRSGE